MTIEEIVYTKKWKIDDISREDFLTLLSEAIEDRLQNFSYKIDDKIDKSSQELEHKIRWE